METAIRWNQRSNHSDPNFLVVDVIGRTFKHCRVTKSTSDSLQWQEVSRNSRAPAFRAFDWNFLYNVVAIGQWSGEANVLRLDNDSEALSLPIKSQRQCNAVAFSPETLLATGLERVRNDFCLNVYDIVHWVGSQKSHSLLLQQPPHEPIRKLATSEGITSIKFFQEQPNVLVAGVKGTCVRIYDLRENSGNPAIQYNTTCAHNLAVDPCDSNYFASAGAPKDSTVQVWDRRSAVRPPTTAPPSAVQFPSLDLPLLSFKDVFRSASDVETSSIWSLRYSIAQPGSLGVLGSNGSVRIFETKQPHADSELRKSYGDIIDESVQTVYVSRTETLGRPLYRPKRGSKDVDAEAERVLAFDFINVLSCNRRPSAIVFHGTQEIRLRELHPTVPTIANSHRNTIACNRSFGLAKSLKANTVLSGVTFLQPSQVGSISESRRKVLMKVENTKRLSTGIVPSPTSPSADGWAETDDDADDGWNEDQSSAQSSPTKVAARDAFPQERGKSLGMIEDALILADTSRRRCVEGYLFDAEKNAIIVQEETELQWMWNWIRVAKENATEDKLVMNGVDFSYVGIQGIWEGNLGPDHSSRLRRPPLSIDVPKIIINLVNNTLDLPEIGLPRTARSYQRRLGLYILGFDPTPDVLLAKVKSMALAGHNSEAALHALLAGDFSLAATALRSGPRHGQNKALSLLLSLRAEKPNDSSLLAQITSIGANEKDPFSLGILSLLTSQTTSSPASLPPVYQLGLALKSLPDPALRSYLANVFNRATTSGNVAYLPLTGITHLSVRLFENYIARTSDLQSVVLALSHASPLYFRNPRIDAWRAEYRNLLNKYGLHIKRAQFDMQSTKLATTWNGQKTIQPERRQVTLKCGNCDGPLHREQEDGDLAKRQKRPPHPTHGKTQSQTLPYPPLLTSQSSDLSTMTTSTMPIGPTSAENSFTSTTSTSTSTEPAPSSSAGSLPTAGPSFALSRTPSLPQPPTSAPFVPDAPSNSATEDPSESVTTPVPPSTATSSITPGTAPGAPQQHRIFGGPKDGTMCPNCGARLPRCAVCDFWVGEVDPRSKGARARTRVRKQKPADTDEDGHEKAVNGKHQQDKDSNGGSEGGESYDEDEDGYEYDESDGDRSIESRRSRKGKKRDPDPMAGFVEICLSCRHVYHRGHAKEWFARHDECAAVGCRCLCGGLDGGVAGT